MNRSKGFTLIELFIAIGIFAVVAIALYSTFFAGISVWRRSGEGGDVYQEIRFTFGDLTRDLKAIVNMYTDTNDEEESIFAFSGTADEIVFMTLESVFSEEGVSQKELVKAVYRFDKDEGELIAIKSGRSRGFDIERSEKEALLKGVEDLKFEYCYFSGDEDDPYLWKEEWGDENSNVPRGIRVTLDIKAANQKELIRFVKTIFVPTGALGEEGEVGL